MSIKCLLGVNTCELTPVILGVGARQGGLVCCSPWGHKELDMTERLNRTELMAPQIPFQQGEEQKANIIMLKLSNH